MMGTTSYFNTFLLFQLFLHLCLNKGMFQFGYATRCKTVEREALFKFKHSLYDLSNRLASWLGEDCCDWAGVRCDNITGHVRHLHLRNPEYFDTDQDDYSDCYNASTELRSHNLDPSLGNLTNLRYLNLAGNDFQESTFPDFIGSMKHLRYLDLSVTLFGGVLPPQLGNLTSLRYLDLSHNSFNGSVPLWLRNMRALKALILDYNFFNHVEGGSLMGIVGNLCKLKRASFSYNYIQGQIGEVYPKCMGELRKLILLNLSKNRFDGQIPSSIGDLSLLEELNLSNNTLDGQIPMSIGRLSLLYSLDVSSNFLKGTLSESHFANLSNLKFLILGLNSLNLNFTSAWIPPFQLFMFEMSHNKIQCPFPRWIQTQTTLFSLDLSHNRIVGPITLLPSSLMTIQLSNNLLSQDNLFTNNYINGTVASSLCQLPYLDYIFLENNSLTGKIPNDCWQNSTFLFSINLSNNEIEGKIPSTLSHRSRSLEILDLGENQFNRQVPNFTGTQLCILRLRDNQLSGVIPLQLCFLDQLQILDLANNNLTGSIPDCLGKLYRMTRKSKEEDLLQLRIGDGINEVLKGELLTYRKTMYLVNLDLSCNSLEGSIPEELSNLSALIGLNLSYNHLTESIPYKIGQMRSLESLDLSNNNINGIIPASMSGLYSLSHLNLSHNKLHGEIPTGQQLQTLNDPSIYAGNRGLCGDPLPHKCIRDNKQKEGKQREPEREEEAEDGKDNRYEKIVFCGVLILGFVTGFWGVIGTLLLKMQWRRALFRSVENFMDYMYVQVAVKINRLKN